MLNQIKKELLKLKNTEKAKLFSRYFKTGKGEYAEGDVFLGVMVPEQRMIAKKYSDISLEDLQRLISEKIHEYRLVSVMILCMKYRKSDENGKKKIFDFYLKNTNNINNWDLIDLSSGEIIGDYLFEKDKSILYKLAKSESIWERRISVMSTFQFIKNNEFDDALKISETLLHDKHDLIHKAVGWMLREIWKRNIVVEENFLKKYYKEMPRTMLRYAIEKFDDKKRKFYLIKK